MVSLVPFVPLLLPLVEFSDRRVRYEESTTDGAVLLLLREDDVVDEVVVCVGEVVVDPFTSFVFDPLVVLIPEAEVLLFSSLYSASRSARLARSSARRCAV